MSQEHRAGENGTEMEGYNKEDGEEWKPDEVSGRNLLGCELARKYSVEISTGGLHGSLNHCDGIWWSKL